MIEFSSSRPLIIGVWASLGFSGAILLLPTLWDGTIQLLGSLRSVRRRDGVSV